MQKSKTWFVRFPADLYDLGPIYFEEPVNEKIVRKCARKFDGCKRLPTGFKCWPVQLEKEMKKSKRRRTKSKPPVVTMDTEPLSRYIATEQGEIFDRVAERLLVQFIKPDGLLYVTILVPSKTKSGGLIPKSRLVAELVLAAFVGSGTFGQIPCHIDGDIENCEFGNLVWGTKKERGEFRSRYWETHKGVAAQGSIKGCGKGRSKSKLTESNVLNIKHLVATGQCRQADLARFYGVTPSVVANIIAGESWKSVADFDETSGAPNNEEN
jgi:hypothetical protein